MPGSHALLRMALRGGAPRTGFRFPIARETPNMYRNNALVRLGIPANTGHWGGRHVAAGDFWSKLAGIGSKVLGVAGTVLTATGIGAPLGLALGGASALLGATQTPHPNQIALPGTGGGVIGAGPGIGGAITIGGQRGVTIGGGITTGGGAGGFTGGGSDVGPSSGVVLANGAVVVTKGHHLNKHGYYTKAHGWIAPGTVLVRNRHRNPLNPRAARRAASRLHGMQKLIGRIERVVSKAARGSGRRVGPRLVASGRRGHKPGCGCFACKRRRSA